MNESALIEIVAFLTDILAILGSIMIICMLYMLVDQFIFNIRQDKIEMDE